MTSKKTHYHPNELKRGSVALLWFLSMITLGIYGAVWYYLRAKEIDKEKIPSKLNQNLTIAYIIITSALIALRIPLNLFPQENVLYIILIIPIILLSLTSLVFYFILAFTTRDILNDIIEKKGNSTRLSGFLTFIFSYLYLQYEINRIIEDRENEKRTAPWVWFLVIIGLVILLFIIMIIFIIAMIYASGAGIM